MSTYTCILNSEKICNECNECNTCDLDPNKVCNNCCFCINQQAEYKSIEIFEIIFNDKD